MQQHNLKYADIVQERDDLRRKLNRAQQRITMLEQHMKFEPQPETLVQFDSAQRFTKLITSLGGGFFS